MKTNNSFGIDFIIRMSKNNSHLAHIFARITIDGDRKEISLKETIKTSDWNSAKEIVNGKTECVRTLNAHIDDVRFKIKEKYRMLSEKDCVITAQAVKDAYLGNHSIQKGKHTLCELMQFHFKIEGEKLRAGTIKNYYTTEDYLKKFIKHKFNLGDFTLDKINFEFITDFEYYVRNYPLKEHDPCSGNGVMKHMERLKKMMRWAIKLQWIEVDLLSNYRLNFKKSKRLKLTIDELMKIEKRQFNTRILVYVKELFLFSCLDPLTDNYPSLTPYQYGSNDPITNIDEDGLEGVISVLADGSHLGTFSKVVITATRTARTFGGTVDLIKIIPSITSIAIHAALIADNAINNSVTKQVGKVSLTSNLTDNTGVAHHPYPDKIIKETHWYDIFNKWGAIEWGDGRNSEESLASQATRDTKIIGSINLGGPNAIIFSTLTFGYGRYEPLDPPGFSDFFGSVAEDKMKQRDNDIAQMKYNNSKTENNTSSANSIVSPFLYGTPPTVPKTQYGNDSLVKTFAEAKKLWDKYYARFPGRRTTYEYW